MAEKATKIKLLKLLEILKKESDEEHPLSSVALIGRLKEMGIPCDRKTLYDDVKTLQELGYDILCNRSSRNEYFVADRDFNVPELRILLDSVQAATFLTEKKTKEFTRKIAALAGDQKAEVLKNNIVEFNSVKSSNESIFYNVDKISSAIVERKKLTFRYFKHNVRHERVYRKGSALYEVDPYSTVFANDNYYLIAYSFDHNAVVNYRVDRMDSVTVSEKDVTKPNTELAFDIKKQKSQLFGMFPGEEETVGFQADNALIDVIFDKFGEKTQLYPIDEISFGFVKSVQISPQFFGWCCGFGDKLKIRTPKRVVDQMKKWLEELSSSYTE